MSWRSWRKITDLAKRREIVLRAADKLGRGRGTARWLDHLNPPPPAPVTPDLRDWEKAELAAVWIGHATVLLRMAGVTLLTDPVFFNRIGLGVGLATLGPRRYFAPALTIAQLPPLDVILISHAHFDHLDRQTLSALPRRTPVITAPRTSDLIRDLGYRTTELAWGEKTSIGPVTITAWPVNHWGARTFFDKHRGYNAYLLESEKYRVLYGADTAMTDSFAELAKRGGDRQESSPSPGTPGEGWGGGHSDGNRREEPPPSPSPGVRGEGKMHTGVDLAIMGIGAYDPFIAAHASPEQVWKMASDAGARFLLPIHHSTFKLSHEPMDEPITRLLAAAGPEADRIVIRRIGEMWKI